ncbi:MAG: AMP-binding protein [Candidatus Xenobia bacterium]
MTRHGNGRGLGFYGRELSWRRVERESCAMAAAMSARGIGPGRSVLVMLPNSPQLVISLIAILKCGARARACDPSGPVPDQAASCDLGIVLDRIHPALRRKAPHLRTVVSSLRDYLPAHLKLLYPIKQRMVGQRWLDLARALDTRLLPFLRRASAPVALPGAGQVGEFSAEAISCGGEQLRECLAPLIKPGRDALLLGVPLWSPEGLQVLALSVLADLTLHLVPRASDDELRRALARTAAALIVADANSLAALAATPRSIAATRVAICTERPSQATMGAFSQAQTRLLASCCSPACGFVALSPLDLTAPPGSCGRPLPGVQVRIADGHLLVHGPQTVTPCEWIETGREARLDGEGWLF